MKKLLALAIVAGSVIAVSSPSFAATCRATSPTGSWGVGYGTPYQARRNALYYCAINTPRGYTCWIRYCTY